MQLEAIMLTVSIGRGIVTIRKMTRYSPLLLFSTYCYVVTDRTSLNVDHNSFYWFFYFLSLKRSRPREGANREKRTNAELHAPRTTVRERLPVAMTMHRLRLGWAKWMDG